MEQRVGMEDLLRRIRREIRRRRAEFYGLRGAFWGGMAGLVVLLVKQGVGGTAPWVAGGLVLVGALAGLVYGAARRIDRLDTARVAAAPPRPATSPRSSRTRRSRTSARTSTAF